MKQALRKNRKRDLMPRDRQATTNCTAPSMVNRIPSISATKPIEIFSFVRKIKPAPISMKEWIKEDKWCLYNQYAGKYKERADYCKASAMLADNDKFTAQGGGSRFFGGHNC